VVHDHSGTIVEIGCDLGEQGEQVLCAGTLRIAGVPEDLAREACRLAALP
jgi:hypothetical protein